MFVGIKGHRGLLEVDERENVIYKPLGFNHDICIPVCNICGKVIIGVTTIQVDYEDVVYILTNKDIIIFHSISKSSYTINYPKVEIDRQINSIFSIKREVEFEPIIMYDRSESNIFPYYFSCIDINGINVMLGVHGFKIEYNYISPIYDKDYYYFKDYLKSHEDICFKYPVSIKEICNYNISCVIGILQNRKIIIKIHNKDNGNVIYRSKKIPEGVFNDLVSWGWWITTSRENTFELYIIYTYGTSGCFTQTIKIDT